MNTNFDHLLATAIGHFDSRHDYYTLAARQRALTGDPVIRPSMGDEYTLTVLSNVRSYTHNMMCIWAYLQWDRFKRLLIVTRALNRWYERTEYSRPVPADLFARMKQFVMGE